MMAERLAVSEGKLMKLHHDEVIKNLVAAKMELAQSQFETLEIQVSRTDNDDHDGDTNASKSEK